MGALVQTLGVMVQTLDVQVQTLGALVRTLGEPLTITQYQHFLINNKNY